MANVLFWSKRGDVACQSYAPEPAPIVGMLRVGVLFGNQRAGATVWSTSARDAHQTVVRTVMLISRGVIRATLRGRPNPQRRRLRNSIASITGIDLGGVDRAIPSQHQQHWGHEAKPDDYCHAAE